jgi:NDP-4-keto-2,6-dideoxyhexose 3-C-methyltransferase
MTKALEAIAVKACKIAKANAGDTVVDIGCNDGTLLRAYKSPGLRRVGFEPAKNLVKDAMKGTDYIFSDFFRFDLFRKRFPDSKAKIVTSIAMFYDLDEPASFVVDVSRILDPRGVWVIQQNYLPTMLKQNGFDNIGHEHLTYYSLQTLSRLLTDQDLEIFDVETNDVNGGSFRTYASHKDQFPVKESVMRLKEYERKLFSRRPSIYDEFAMNVRMIGFQLRHFVTKEVKSGRRIYVYGASTRGNTILQYCKLNHSLIEKATDANPEKWGRRTPGTGIPIVSKEEARKDKPDYFLVLPHHFLDEIRRQESDYLHSGGKFIVPLPEFRIVTQSTKDPQGSPKKFDSKS